jgi:cytochrome bd-type quinol oxidase subunit 2
VRLSRLRPADRLALLAALGLAILLGFDWFFLSTPDARIGAHESGIRSLGWFAELIVVGAIVATFAMAYATATQEAPAWPIVLTVVSVLLSILAVLVIAVRLVAQPGLGVEASNADVEVELPALLGLITAIGMAVGACRSMADERTDTEEARAQTEAVLRVRGAPRPAPPATNPAGPGRPDALADPPSP